MRCVLSSYSVLSNFIFFKYQLHSTRQILLSTSQVSALVQQPWSGLTSTVIQRCPESLCWTVIQFLLNAISDRDLTFHKAAGGTFLAGKAPKSLPSCSRCNSVELGKRRSLGPGRVIKAAGEGTKNTALSTRQGARWARDKSRGLEGRDCLLAVY